MNKCPCHTCERKGCGAYHDECKQYQEFHQERMSEYERKKNLIIKPYKRRKFNDINRFN